MKPIKPLTKKDYEGGKLIRLVHPLDVAPRARPGVEWLAELKFSDSRIEFYMVGSSARARQLWPEKTDIGSQRSEIRDRN